MFWLGTFGCNSAAGRRYHRHAFGALAVLAVAVIVSVWLDRRFGAAVGKWVAGVGTPLVFTYIVAVFHRYIGELDELARRVQLEAVLIAFLFVILGGIALFSVWMFTGWAANPAWVLLAEPVRGVGLIVAARRYR